MTSRLSGAAILVGAAAVVSFAIALADARPAQAADITVACPQDLETEHIQDLNRRQLCAHLRAGVAASNSNDPGRALQSYAKTWEELSRLDSPALRAAAVDEIGVARAIALAQNRQWQDVVAFLDGFHSQAAGARDTTILSRALLYVRAGEFEKGASLLAQARETLPEFWCDNREGMLLASLNEAQPNVDGGTLSMDAAGRHGLPSWFIGKACYSVIGDNGTRLKSPQNFPLRFNSSSADLVVDRRRTGGVQNMRMLDQMIGILRQYPDTTFELIGHTDETCFKDRRPCVSGNVALSTERAQAVLRALVERGIPPERLMARGEGTYNIPRPYGKQKAEERNRIVELVPVAAKPSDTVVDAACPWEVQVLDPGVVERKNNEIHPVPIWLTPTVKGTPPTLIIGAEAGIVIRYKASNVPYSYISVRDNHGSNPDLAARHGFASDNARALLNQGGRLPVDSGLFIEPLRDRVMTINLKASTAPIPGSMKGVQQVAATLGDMEKPFIFRQGGPGAKDRDISPVLAQCTVRVRMVGDQV